ncbi:MAG: hypothetical protein GF364_17175 [Candidatus Lokiarchaeota archaeon]|nr:hypothetical protein [Candidatus Lokiarchaeota archaeon]
MKKGKKDANKDKKDNPFRFDGIDDFIKNFFGMNRSKPFLPMENKNEEDDGSDRHVKKNSFTYRFGTGMDKPDIRINGKPVDINDNIFKRIMSQGLPEGFNPNMMPTNQQVIDAGEVSLGNTPINYSEDDYRPQDDMYEEPYYEIEKLEDKLVVTIELPSVKEENIVINYYENNVTITAENEIRRFRKSFELEFEPDKEETLISGRNGIYEIEFHKKSNQ